MADDDLVDGARWCLQQRDGVPPVPAPAEAVAEVEALVGYKMPTLLRRLYLEVADGWPYWLSIDRLTTEYQGWVVSDGEPDPDDQEYLYLHPRTLVPVTETDCGGHATFVEFGTAQGNIWMWNQEVGCPRHHLFAAPFTVADCVAHWTHGPRLRPWRQEPDKHCRRCRSEGERYGKCNMGIPDWCEGLRRRASAESSPSARLGRVAYPGRVSSQLSSTSNLTSSSPRRTLNPRQAETVEKLFGATSALLDDVGHEQITVRMVASRAGVSPATAYTYFASKDHLFAELFWRRLASAPSPVLGGATPEARVRQAVTHLAELMAGSPTLAAAATTSLLGSDPEVQRLRLAIGRLWIDRFREAIGDDADADLIETLAFAFTGVLLQAGIGISSYDRLADVLDRVVGVIMRGAPTTTCS
jgi:AcrR family transcriptional regulator